ncbi:prepilin peptidase [Allokutzneria albata]|uniref:Leader peptidase (Prepilin peptidase) / N-methyltransferase n=1 Tax=Allokutzneria albata TaxID=211114 RepID=A0A1H0DK37_ALLAB|nr:A24 family peptidase [Allokutzneria albata]SDN70494.1 leader peptidase (prepilin peptidase) / N-methyltransferase [Allokutzneria albata]
MEVLGALSGLVAGVVAGAGTRVVLGRLDRGASVRPPWCELAVGVLWAIMCGVGAPLWWLPVQLAIAWFAVALTAVDLCHRRLPDALTLPAYPIVGLVLLPAVLAGPGPPLVVRAVCGAALFLVVHAVVRMVSPDSLGAGDVKLSGSLGAVAGAVEWVALPVVVVLAAVITAIVGVFFGCLRRSESGGGQIPHGPGLLLATVVLALVPPGGQPVFDAGVPEG